MNENVTALTPEQAVGERYQQELSKSVAAARHGRAKRRIVWTRLLRARLAASQTVEKCCGGPALYGGKADCLDPLTACAAR
jgi:hypothetical protein